MAVRIDKGTVYEPDAQVYCGPELPGDALLSEAPIIVVEVMSPSTGRNDALRKLEGYFRLPSVRHYLILSPDEPLVIHHARGEGETIITRIFRSGVIALDPPGLKLDLTEVYGAINPKARDEAFRRIAGVMRRAHPFSPHLPHRPLGRARRH